MRCVDYRSHLYFWRETIKVVVYWVSTKRNRTGTSSRVNTWLETVVPYFSRGTNRAPDKGEEFVPSSLFSTVEMNMV